MPKRKSQRAVVSLLALTLVGVAAPGCAGHLDRAHDAITIGDEAAAEVHLRKALNSSSTQAEAARMLSILLSKQGNDLAGPDPRKAEQRYDEALDLDPANEEARLGLARLLMKRGFMADAKELLAVEGCVGCGRLEAMMLHEQAVKAVESGEMDTARGLFQQAFDVGNDPLDALGLAQTFIAAEPPDLMQAKALLELAAPRIARGQVEAEQKFRELRYQLLMAAAAARNNELVDLVFRIRTPELEEEPEFDLRFKVSQQQFRNGDSDPAIERITSLLEKSGQYIEPTQREVMTAALVVMYSARAAQHLGANNPVGAAKDIAAGLKLDEGNNRLKLQQVLAIAANRLELAFTELEKAKKNNDAIQVEAILWSLQALAEVDAGSISKAQAALDKAEALSADLPEVHLAKAYILAELRNDDLKKKDLQEARKIAGFDYPSGRVNQYPSALAHLARAQALVIEQGTLHPWRGAGFDQRVEALKTKLAFFPYEVEWYNDKGGLIEIFAESGRKDVEFNGPRWLKGTAIASPGKPAEIQVPNVGLVFLEFDGKQLGVITESGAHIKIKL